MSDTRVTADTGDFAVYGSSYFAASMVRRAALRYNPTRFQALRRWRRRQWPR